VIVVAQWFEQGFEAFFSNGVFQIIIDCGGCWLRKLAELGEFLFDTDIGASAGKFVGFIVDGGKGLFELRFEFLDVAAKVVILRSFAAGKLAQGLLLGGLSFFERAIKGFLLDVLRVDGGSVMRFDNNVLLN